MKKKYRITFKYAGNKQQDTVEEPEKILSRVYNRIFDKALGNLLVRRSGGKA